MKKMNFEENAITGRATRSEVAHLNDIRRYHSLTRDEEQTLVNLLLAGGPAGRAARERLITSQLRLVVSMAKMYATSSVEFDDLVAGGEEGLVRAIDSISAPLTTSVTSYVLRYIQGGVLDALGECSQSIAVPRSAAAVLRDYEQRLEAQNEGDLSPEELLDNLDALQHAREWMDRENVDAAALHPFVSLDAPLTDDTAGEAVTLAELLPDTAPGADEELERADSRRALRALMTAKIGALPTNILMDKYGFFGPEYTDIMLCEKYGLNHRELEQIVRKALKDIRHEPSILELLMA